MKILLLMCLSLSQSYANKIIGGQNADEGQFPSMALQTKLGSFFCGGTIISDYDVLSAAHCNQINFVGHEIVAGTTKKFTGGIVKAVVAKVIHNAYDSSTFESDIMILRVENAFRFNDDRFPLAVAPIAVDRPAEGTSITVAGWGDTDISSTGQAFPTDLQYVVVSVIADDTCNSAAAYNGSVLDGMICMGDMAGGIDSCQGDSGGPAYISGTDIVAGITSWGYGCARQNKPGVYTDVAYFSDWITDYML